MNTEEDGRPADSEATGAKPYEPPLAEDLDTAEGTVATASWVVIGSD